MTGGGSTRSQSGLAPKAAQSLGVGTNYVLNRISVAEVEDVEVRATSCSALPVLPTYSCAFSQQLA
jgi:hypothetical protein